MAKGKKILADDIKAEDSKFILNRLKTDMEYAQKQKNNKELKKLIIKIDENRERGNDDQIKNNRAGLQRY